MRRWRLPVLIVTLLLLLVPAGTAWAQVYFPPTGHWLQGRFLEYWEESGGLPVFGYPLTEELIENNQIVQYFERQRFEQHPEFDAPYDVLLGLLGYDAAQNRGLLGTAPFQPLPTGTMSDANCTYFPETRHRACWGFRSYWQTHGLNFGDPGISFRESLALFGYPISEEFTDPASGLTVQYFERARFEWHPNNPPAFHILLGRLGAEVRDALPPGHQDTQLASIYLVALDDGGQSGRLIGCNDSLVPVRMGVNANQTTEAKITEALGQLFAIDDQFYGESGLYNALYQSNLTVQSVTIMSGTATINLTGTLTVGGVCDEPRVEEQIREVALQFPDVDDAVVLHNGGPLFPNP